MFGSWFLIPADNQVSEGSSRQHLLSAMRPSSTLSLLALGSVAQAAVSLENSSLPPRDIENFKRAIEARSLADDIWNDIKNAATCTACQVRKHHSQSAEYVTVYMYSHGFRAFSSFSRALLYLEMERLSA